MSKNKSIIYSISAKEFRELINRSSTIREVLAFFGLENKGGNSKTLKNRMREENISIASLLKRSKEKSVAALKKGHIKRTIPLSEILVENSTYTNTTNLKKKLLEAGLMVYSCSKCGNSGDWYGETLVLQLEHKNGDNQDHRLENLTLLCPNCHSQTSTFAGKNNKDNNKANNKCRHFYEKKYTSCLECGANIGTKTKTNLCPKCYSNSRRKVDRPPLEQLLKDVEELGYCGTGRKYGVSDNAIRKWIKNYGDVAC